MPQPELRDRYQAVVLWPLVAYDTYGQPTVGPPQEIRARWKFVRREVVNAQGNTVAIDATAVVNLAIKPGSCMWLGRITDLTGTGVGASPASDVMEVVTYNETPDLRNRVSQREVTLMRRMDNLPAVIG